MAADDLRIKLLPDGEPGVGQLVVGPKRKSVACGANADERPARGEIGAHGVELLLRRRAAADAEEEQVRIFERGFDAGKTVLVPGISIDDLGLIAVRFQLFLRK